MAVLIYFNIAESPARSESHGSALVLLQSQTIDQVWSPLLIILTKNCRP